MNWRIELDNGIWLPDIDWRLDARKPVDRSFVSHAHFDHMGKHQTILCSPGTAKLAQVRLSGTREYSIHAFGDIFEIAPGTQARLLPAGHIIGSAMLWLERDGCSLLYTGDFKLSDDGSAESCQPERADELIIETTYGIPKYVFPSDRETKANITQFCRDTLENGDTPVLFGYSLGKSQAILRSLAETGLPAMLHPQSFALTESCETLGWSFPPYSAFDQATHEGKVVISPPLPKDSAFLKSIKNPKTAIISGWAIDPSAVYRYGCDHAFPLSDHADYLDLQEFVARVQPKRIYTIHGFAKEFAQTLREQGYEAWALGVENQLSLPLKNSPSSSPSPSASSATPSPSLRSNSLSRLAKTATALADTRSYNQKASLLTEYLRELEPQDIGQACLFLSGQCVPRVATHPLALDAKLVKEAVQQASDATEAERLALYQQSRDNAEVAAELIGRRAVAPSRTIDALRRTLGAIALATSDFFRLSLIVEEFRKLDGDEARFLFRLLSGTLRLDLPDEVITRAVSEIYGRDPAETLDAYLRSDDLPEVCRAAAEDSLSEVAMNIFRPLPLMQAVDLAEADLSAGPLWVEDLYDGIRCQIHKVGERVELYSAELKSASQQFSEITEIARAIPQDFVAEGVVVAWGYERPLPKSDLLSRLTRKGEDLFLGEETDIALWLFDLLWKDGKSLVALPLSQRRSILDTFTLNPKIRMAPVHNLPSAGKIPSILADSQARGHRGLIVKDASQPYRLGQTNPRWQRIK